MPAYGTGGNLSDSDKEAARKRIVELEADREQAYGDIDDARNRVLELEEALEWIERLAADLSTRHTGFVHIWRRARFALQLPVTARACDREAARVMSDE